MMEVLRDFGRWWQSMVDFPALILGMIFLLGWYVLHKTQKADNDFDFSHMLRDEYGKPSAGRLAMFVCLAITTWGFMYIIMKTGTIDTMLFLGYAAIWSGAKVAETAIMATAARRGWDVGGHSSNYGPGGGGYNGQPYPYKPPYRGPDRRQPAGQRGGGFGNSGYPPLDEGDGRRPPRSVDPDSMG